MIPDDRLEALLREADAMTSPDPMFLDGLAGRLEAERRRRRTGLRVLGRRVGPFATRAIAASLVAAVGAAGVLAVIGLEGTSPWAGTSTPSPAATDGSASPGRPRESQNPTATAPSSPTPGASAVSSGEPAAAGCSLAFDAQPVPGGQMTLLATGFEPGAPLTLIYATANGERRTLVGGLDHLARAGADGSAELGVFEWTKPLARRDRGRYVWRVTDGSCEARIAADVPPSDGSP